MKSKWHGISPKIYRTNNVYIVYMYDGSYIVDHANILLLLFSNIQRNGERVGEEAGDKEVTNRNESWRVGDASYWENISYRI